MNNRLKQFLLRIADLVYLSIIAYTVFFLILQSETLSSLFLFLSESFNLLPKPIGFLLLGCIGFSLPIFLKKHNCYNINHTLVNDAKNPPIYLVPIFVILPSIFIHSELQELLHTSAIFAFTVGLFLCLCMMLINDKKEENHTEKSKISFDMKTWLEQEVPISNKNYDFLGFHAYVERITTLLEDNSKNKSHQIAIRGDFGTGKSSLCRLLEEKLTSVKSKNFIFCFVDGWGREDSSFAGQILEIVIEKLSEHTDCSSLIGVPESYINALNGSGLNSLATATQLFSPTQKSDPEKHLRKIDDLLASINYQMVITLEDFDRGPNPSKAINELGSLLERTKDLKKVHFLLCIKQETSTIIDKICTHIEDIHEIPTNSSATLIKELIAYIEKEYPSEATIKPINYHFIPEINPIIKTPRSLKQALRRTSTAWKNLKGEIDFIDLLHFNVIRFCAPDCFSFLLKNFSAFKSINEMKKNYDITRNRLDSEINQLNMNHEDIRALKILIETFFGSSNQIFNPEPNDPVGAAIATFGLSTSPRNLQRLEHGHLTNYFNRAIKEHIPDEEAKDQDILRCINSETKNNKATLKLIQKSKTETSYQSHLYMLKEWLFKVSDHKEKYFILSTIAIAESDRLFIPKKCPNLYNRFDEQDSGFPKQAYILMSWISHILESALNTNNQPHEIIDEIFFHLLSDHTSVAIELLNKHYEYSVTIKHKFQNLIETATYSKILESIDPMHTEALYTLYKCKNHPIKVSTINEFYEAIFSNKENLKTNIIPLILYGIEREIEVRDDLDGQLETQIIEYWDETEIFFLEKDTFKNLITRFEETSDMNYQFHHKTIELVTRWKKLVQDELI